MNDPTHVDSFLFNRFMIPVILKIYKIMFISKKAFELTLIPHGETFMSRFHSRDVCS